MAGKAIVAGGSIGGLFAALALIRKGWDVAILERASRELSGRGAGIVTHPELIAALRAVGAETSNLGVAVEERVAFDHAGSPVKVIAHPQIVTSWDRIHRGLRNLLPTGTYVLGATVTDFRQSEREISAECADGSRFSADILVGADGFRSAVRGRILPKVQPRYCGYVVWRALAREADLPPAVRRLIFDAFGFFLPNGAQVVGYPIAGPGNDLRPGRRRYNFVWYAAVPEQVLREMLTDADGTLHPVSIPPPLIRREILLEMRANAAQLLPKPFVETLEASERPFFTPIYDHLSPVMHDGRVALVGDAACVARPHVGMGVTKAAEDSLALARHLEIAPIHDALAAYSTERVPEAREAWERSRRLGTYIFEGPSCENADGRRNPKMEQIMRETAVSEFHAT